jgi:Rrf2 family protein
MGEAMNVSPVEDYAVRALVDLAAHPNSSVREIAARTGIPGPHLAKVVQALARASLVETSRGRKGGVWLARSPSEIRLIDVVEAVQGPIRVLRCPRRGKGCPRDPNCALYRLWNNLQNQIAGHLNTMRISDLLQTCPNPGPPQPDSSGAS